jgi:hypothetical protein
MQCDQCAYYSVREIYDGSKDGFCRRYPAIVPKEANDWCAEFKLGVMIADESPGPETAIDSEQIKDWLKGENHG